ncbi:MAG: hypothetical protein IJM81_10065 [Prevotella sp.]|nr:hypothetical protein [Prevotella sp.]
MCSCPHATIHLQPFEDFSKEEVQKLLLQLQENFDNLMYGGWSFEILDPIPLPKESFVLKKNKYKAIDILNFEKKHLKDNEIIYQFSGMFLQELYQYSIDMGYIDKSVPFEEFLQQ